MSLQEDLEKMDEEETAYQAKRKAKLAEEKRKRDKEAKDHRRKLAAKQEKLYAEYARQVIPIMRALCKRDGVDYTTMTPDQIMATPAKVETSDSVDYKAIVEAFDMLSKAFNQDLLAMYSQTPDAYRELCRQIYDVFHSASNQDAGK